MTTLSGRWNTQRTRVSDSIGIVGSSHIAQSLREFANRASSWSGNILLTGESGVGKDLAARHIHNLRGHGQFVYLNCGSVQDTMVETELFGHARGAFTDAKVEKVGLLEVARNGILFLDEIGNMSPSFQAKLLSVLDGKSYRKVGSVKEEELKVRFISATNSNLKRAVQSGTFREDLYYRLRHVEYTIPPLRKRREDIPELVDSFLASENMVFQFSPDALTYLKSHPWPGNVRQLRNFLLEVGFHLGLRSIPVTVEDILSFLPEVAQIQDTLEDHGLSATLPSLNEWEKIYLERLIRQTKGKMVEAVKIARIRRNVLYNRLRKHGLGELGRLMREG